MATRNEMAVIHLVGGEKGGVGKSFLSRALCQYLKEHRHQKFALVEADSQIDDVGRVYHKQAQKTATIRLSDDQHRATEPDVIVDLAIKAPVVVNLPSNTLDVLERWIEHTSLLDYLETERRQLVKWFVSDGCYESIRELHRSIHQFDHRIPHIVVLNQGRLNGVDFSYLEDESMFQEVKQAPNCFATIDFPRLESKLQFWIDKHQVTLAQARERIQAYQGILAKQRIHTFLKSCYAQFDAAMNALEERSSTGSNVLLSASNIGETDNIGETEAPIAKADLSKEKPGGQHRAKSAVGAGGDCE